MTFTYVYDPESKINFKTGKVRSTAGNKKTGFPRLGNISTRIFYHMGEYQWKQNKNLWSRK